MKRAVRRILFFIFGLSLLTGGVLAYEAHRFLSTPASPEPEEFVFTVRPGATFDRVAWDLKKAGALSDVFRFRLLAMSEDALGKIRAGEYVMNTGWTPPQVLRQLTQGQALLYRLSLREGLTWWETARAIEEQGFARYEDFKAVIHDPAFLREMNIPFANAEGFLFPETYLMKKPRSPLDRDQAREIAAVMVRAFWKKSEPVWRALPAKSAAGESVPGALASPARNATSGNVNATVPSDGANAATVPSHAALPANGGNATIAPGNATLTATATPAATGPRTAQDPGDIDPEALRRLVILASLVERETGVPAERGLVAGVYANRLRLGMLLQCDPTIIYGVGESFSGAIRRSQLDDPKNKYNTYQHPGLPPGPICSPGLDALKAALTPTPHEFLYFVATGQNSGHTFSKSLAEHNKAVRIYRQKMRGQ